MIGIGGGRCARWLGIAIALVGFGSAIAPSAQALEALEGRVQLHGFVEAQIRGLSSQYSDEFDLAQWYNVLNLELELDILPDGWGPMDLLEAYVRVEARYDCVWTRGCGTMRSANTYGDRAKRLPGRLRGAQDPDYSGVIQPTPPNGPVSRITDKRPAPFAPLTISDTNGIFGANDVQVTVDDRAGIGFGTLFEQKGADNILGTADDPGVYTNSPILDYRFALLENNKGAPGSGGQTLISGPWDPKSFIQSNALLIDKANPFRGAQSYMALYTEGVSLSEGNRNTVGYRGNDPLDPFLVNYKAELFDADDQGITLGNDQKPATSFVPVLTTATLGDITGDSFAGDYNGILPCWDPTSGLASAQIDGVQFADNCYANLPRDPVSGEVDVNGETISEFGKNVDIRSGQSELPMRPAPDLSNLTSQDASVLLFGEAKDKDAAAKRLALGFSGNNSNLLYAQGLYVPSMGLRRELAKGIDPDTGVPKLNSKGIAKGSGKFDNLDFNYREAERAWNRGQSQQDTKELKEAYLDIEWMDSRLWTRIGLQNIVWGKTELFRTTDQFNPQDLALASLPSLEESRIALWAARFVYSLYDVGPMEDVRVEFAFNFDNYQPADLGAAGEPFTPDLVGLATTGILFHSITGVGVAGVDRPENPWDSIKGLEIGGRVEWRWDRFSFALTDFYGYSDFPFPDRIFTYDRTVAMGTGRPLIAESMVTDECDTPSAGTFTNQGEAGGQPTAPDTVGTAVDRTFDDPKNPLAASPFGIGTNPACLKGGGAPGFESENLAGGEQNALYFHHANQQLFAWICSATVSIAAVLDAGSCAFNIFGSPKPIGGEGVLEGTPPFIEVITTALAGERHILAQGWLGIITSQTKEGFTGPDSGKFTNPSLKYPLASLNLDFGPGGESTGWDGVITASHPNINAHNEDAEGYVVWIANLGNLALPYTTGPDCDDSNSVNKGQAQFNPTASFFGLTVPEGVCKQFRFHYDTNDFLTLDSTLSNAQRALIGCGPFYGTRCDSGDEVWILPQGTYDSIGDARDNTTQLFNAGGGIDFLNAEASALLSAWPGTEGTAPLGDKADAPVFWTSFGQADQPGTVNFDGGPTCTRPVGTGKDLELMVLPGCRGIASIDPIGVGTAAERVEVTFDDNYLPSVDGCVVSADIGGVPVIFPGVQPGSRLDQELNSCANDSRHKTGGFQADIPLLVNQGSGTMFHPIAGCLPDTEAQRQELGFPDSVPLAKDALTQDDCVWFERDYPAEFLGLDPSGRTAQVFRSEMAAFSFNFLTFLVITSCNRRDGDDIGGDQECFNPKLPLKADKCSFNAPHLCTNVKGFLTVAGVTRNTVNAGGNEKYGRRTFSWHGGGEIVLRYEKRNVLGFSMDFAEDVTKSNWSMEFTWIEGTPFIDSNARDNVTRSDAYNLTVSVDRPTFINFLNPNRTFFINSQWFFQYLPDHKGSFTSNGPVNVLFTLAAFTGYFQDRLLPQFVSVFDVNSQSGGLLPSISYRFTEAFSATIGMNWFFGRTQRVRMPMNEIAPPGNRAPNRNGNFAYKDGADNLLSLIRHRDEAYIRLRWTF